MEKALITGASGGIGYAIAKELAANGINLILHHNGSDISEKEEYLEKTFGVNVVSYKCDFSYAENAEEFSEKIIREHNDISILVNNAGLSIYGLFQDSSYCDFEKIMNVNLTSPMIITKNIIKNMISFKRGNIINISSIWGQTGASCEVLYSATKSGIIGFTKALAKELAPSGIKVNCITPGIIDTKMISMFSSDELKSIKEEIPMGRIGLPEDIANAVEFLISEKSSYITGEILKVNGGFYI